MTDQHTLTLLKSCFPGYCGGYILVPSVSTYDCPAVQDSVARVGLVLYPRSVKPVVEEAEHDYDCMSAGIKDIGFTYRIVEDINDSSTGTVLDDLNKADTTFSVSDMDLKRRPLQFNPLNMVGLNCQTLVNFITAPPKDSSRTGPSPLGKIADYYGNPVNAPILFAGTSPASEYPSISAKFLQLLYTYGTVIDFSKEFPWMPPNNTPVIRVLRDDFSTYISPLMCDSSDFSLLNGWSALYVTLLPPMFNLNYHHRTFIAAISFYEPLQVK